jgi:hypothetical protein
MTQARPRYHADVLGLVVLIGIEKPIDIES